MIFTKELLRKEIVFIHIEKSIRHNPMGGIMFRIFLNSDEKLVVYYTLQKDSRTGKTEYSGGGYSQEVGKLIGEGN